MTRSPYDGFLSHRLQVLGLRVFCGLVLLFLIAPILAIMPLSFSSGSLLTFPLPGLSLRWYEFCIILRPMAVSLAEQLYRRYVRNRLGNRPRNAGGSWT